MPSEYEELFLSESQENLTAMNRALVALEKKPSSIAIME